MLILSWEAIHMGSVHLKRLMRRAIRISKHHEFVMTNSYQNITDYDLSVLTFFYCCFCFYCQKNKKGRSKEKVIARDQKENCPSLWSGGQRSKWCSSLDISLNHAWTKLKPSLNKAWVKLEPSLKHNVSSIAPALGQAKFWLEPTLEHGTWWAQKVVYQKAMILTLSLFLSLLTF